MLDAGKIKSDAGYEFRELSCSSSLQMILPHRIYPDSSFELPASIRASMPISQT
jgi:hypothetical protein